MKKLVMTIVMSSLLCWGGGSFASDDKAPISLLTMVKGTVEYSKDGKKWKQVRRNKLLFEGYTIRTGADGAGQFINQTTGEIREVSNNSEVIIKPEGASPIVGQLSKIDSSDATLLASLEQRFAKAQRYTTVRRAVIKHEDISLQVPREITLSTGYPQLVWENPGKNYHYRLTINDKSYEVPATEEALVTFSVEPMPAGEYAYTVDLLDGDKVVFSTKREATIRWMSEDDWSGLQQRSEALKQRLNGDDFFMATMLEESGLFVPALQHYQRYFTEYPEDNDLRPMYIQLLHTLKLKQMRMAEAEIYNANLE